MTLSTSEHKLRKAVKVGFFYLLAAGFCALFGGVYEHFSHGVYSPAMVYAFAYPLAGGAIPFLALGLWDRAPGESNGLYHCGIATLTLGSIIRGVLEIYGTDSRLTLFYPCVGWLLVGAGIAIWFLDHCRQKRT